MRKQSYLTSVTQRNESLDSLDDFPTPPWATRALLQYLINHGEKLHQQTVWEPAANRGYMAETLKESFHQVIASDIHDYQAGYKVYDFLRPPRKSKRPDIDWIITNPPFKLSLEFALQALQTYQCKTALFCRIQWLESQIRYQKLFINNPPSNILIFSRRVGLVKGQYNPNINKTLVVYAWFIWRKSRKNSKLDWIPPETQSQLEKPLDIRLRRNKKAMLREVIQHHYGF